MKYTDKYIWILHPAAVNYDIAVIKQFSPHELILNICKLDGSKITNQESYPAILELQDLGYTCCNLDIATIQQSRNLIIECDLFGESAFLYNKNLQNSRAIMMIHAVDSYMGSFRAPHWYIYAHQAMAEYPEEGKISRTENQQLFKQVMKLPVAMKNEFAYSGPYHIGDWAKKRFIPKEVLQEELAAKLQCTFSPEKPVVAFFGDEFCHQKQVFEGLKRLAPHVNLVCKTNGRDIEAISGVAVYPPYEYAPNLLRFAADYILAGFASGTLFSSTMLGCNVIPYYTTMLINMNRKRVSYTADAIKRPLSLQGLHVPVNLQDTEAILSRMYDDAWWNQYKLDLSRKRHAIFGNYSIDNAAEKTAQLIRKVFEQETFGEDTTAVRLRPEAGKLIKVSRGNKTII